MAVVVFDPTSFKLRYPEFAAVSNTLLALFFDEATLYMDNSDTSIVQDIPRRTTLLNMVTAHITALSGSVSPDGQPKPVGRISSAGEGSVSVNLEYMAPGTMAWFVQTQYGAAFWQATSSLRGFRYFPNPTTW